MYANYLHWLLSTSLLFQSAFCWLYKFTTADMVPLEGSNLAMRTWYCSHCHYTCLYRLCNGILASVSTCGCHIHCHSHSKLCHLCHVLLLCFSLCHHIPCLYHPPTLYADPKVLHSLKNHQELVKIIHYLFARLVVQNLIANYIARQLCFVLLTNKSNSYHGFLRLNFKNGYFWDN